MEVGHHEKNIESSEIIIYNVYALNTKLLHVLITNYYAHDFLSFKLGNF